ncbi:Trp biosynthesis-associated membrane protein [Tomitella fengzijianii]|uniref:Trp biosynthesis-associated membrane protein n=1 Tax=Tomitella fengzijianii TaxID=2597660 RepID=A0A516X497_9ACTN|nr:Trp biosynthesis-associated membrane protein [Tomitella fengzijianii]QDQ97823.1 Trp biosynthesis-associated membrane protein [Tomitella fengzijianii]
MSGGEGAATRRGDARRMVVEAGLLALGALVTWAAGRMDWVGYTYENGLQPPVDGSFDGAAWASELTPLALVLLAGIAAMFAVRGWAQRVIGLIVTAAGATIVVRSSMALSAAADPAEVTRLGDLRAGAVVTAAQTHPGPIVLAIVGGVLAAAAGLLMVVRPRPRRELPSKYETPAARRDSVAKAMAARRDRAKGPAGAGQGASAGGGADDDMTQRLMWEALDSGADPTDDEDPAGGAGDAAGPGGDAPR